MTQKKRSGFQVCAKLIGLVKPLTGYMLLAIFMGLLGHLCAAWISILAAEAILVIADFGSVSLSVFFVLMLFLALLRAGLRYGEQGCNHYIAFRLLALIRDRVFRTLRRLCPAKLEGRDKGDLISLITSDIELLEVFYAHTISPVAIYILFSAILTVYIGRFHAALGCLALAAYGCVGILMPLVFSKLSKQDGEAYRGAAADLSAFVLESLRGLSETIQYNGGEKRLAQMKEKSEKIAETQAHMKQVAGRNAACTNTVILFFDVSMLFLAGTLYLQGSLSFGGVLLPTIALMSSFGPAIALANLGTTLQSTFAAGNRVLDILEEEPQTKDVTGMSEISFDGISAKEITFAYQEETILEDFSMEVPKAGIVGILGKSGCGKSTFLKLLMRFWSVDAGEIAFDGRNIEAINTQNLRDLEGYMTQDTHLFCDSIAANLRIAKQDATDEELEAACRKASIHDFIVSLPKGYDTPVGELGDTLSGGERQRLGLARAFLHDAPLLLLDEPTSNLDSLNEAVILKALDAERKEKSIVLVSHRASTLRVCDRVVEMSKERAAT